MTTIVCNRLGTWEDGRLVLDRDGREVTGVQDPDDWRLIRWISVDGQVLATTARPQPTAAEDAATAQRVDAQLVSDDLDPARGVLLAVGTMVALAVALWAAVA